MPDFTENLGLTLPIDGFDYDTWGLSTNANWVLVDKASGKVAVLTTAGGVAVVTTDQSAHARHEINGTLTEDLVVRVPDAKARFWFVTNETLGNQTVTYRCATGAGTSCRVDQGRSAIVLSDGVDCIAMDMSTLGGLNHLSGPSSTVRRIREIIATSDTLRLTDAGGVVLATNFSATSITVPPNSDVPFPIGTQIDIGAETFGLVTVVEGAGVLVNSEDDKKNLATRYSAATLLKKETNVWSLYGSLQP